MQIDDSRQGLYAVVHTGQLVSIRDYELRGCGLDPQSGLQIFYGAPPLDLL